MKGLTPRQSEILDVIRGHVRLHGFPPTIRELGALVGIGSTNGVDEHLKAIERKGYIARPRDGRSRAIVLLDTPREADPRLASVLAFIDWLETEGRCSRVEADRCRQAAQTWASTELNSGARQVAA